MHYEVKQILKKIEGAVICEMEGQKNRYTDTSMIHGDAIPNDFVLASIRAKDNTIILTFKKCNIENNNLKDPWIKSHVKEFGEKPSFF